VPVLQPHSKRPVQQPMLQGHAWQPAIDERAEFRSPSTRSYTVRLDKLSPCCMNTVAQCGTSSLLQVLGKQTEEQDRSDNPASLIPSPARRTFVTTAAQEEFEEALLFEDGGQSPAAEQAMDTSSSPPPAAPRQHTARRMEGISIPTGNGAGPSTSASPAPDASHAPDTSMHTSTGSTVQHQQPLTGSLAGGISAAAATHGGGHSAAAAGPSKPPASQVVAYSGGDPGQGNLRRALTKPSLGARNEGFDNENSDLVLYVGEALINQNPSAGISRKYVIQDMLGQVRLSWGPAQRRTLAHASRGCHHMQGHCCCCGRRAHLAKWPAAGVRSGTGMLPSRSSRTSQPTSIRRVAAAVARPQAPCALP
jgi:hypothetical protein